VSRMVLATENLVLRQQLMVLHRATHRPRLRHRDRLFWTGLLRLWPNWRSLLVIVKPETVIKWHRQGFKCYRRWNSRHGRVGRPKIGQEFRELIRRMSREHPRWGVPRIQAELHLLGCEVAESTARSIDSEVVSLLRKHGKAFCRIMLARSQQLTFSRCLL
jgi:putative transposase